MKNTNKNKRYIYIHIYIYTYIYLSNMAPILIPKARTSDQACAGGTQTGPRGASQRFRKTGRKNNASQRNNF